VTKGTSLIFGKNDKWKSVHYQQLDVTVKINGAGRILRDDLHAAVGRIVDPLALLAVVVTHVVSIPLIKLAKNDMFPIKRILILSPETPPNFFESNLPI